ncbi:MAG: crotonase/enoyl-CoA hydratase family protein [Pseudomonadota bacterium]
MSAEETNNVLVEKDGPVTVVTINRPHVRNAVDPQTGDALRAIFQAFDADPDQSAAVLCGADGNFCAGFDLKSVSTGTVRHEPKGEGLMGPTRLLLSKPVIAAVEGYAVAGGLELALWCDMRVAASTAVFGVYCRRWGVPLIDGGTIRLPRIIGHGRALDMILTGRPVEAEEALGFGLANRVVPKGHAVTEAIAIARDLARYPQTCMRTDRMTAHRQWGMDIADALTLEAMEGETPLQEEAVRGAARFADGKGRSGNFDEI